jgi:hypothetical protein
MTQGQPATQTKIGLLGIFATTECHDELKANFRSGNQDNPRKLMAHSVSVIYHAAPNQRLASSTDALYPVCCRVSRLHTSRSAKTATKYRPPASMPRLQYEDLISLRGLDSASDLISPIIYRHSRQSRDDRYYPYDSRQRPQRTDDELPKVQKILEELTKPGIVRQGDLGWTLEYATAYCYKHLNGNRPCIVDAIDTARQAPLGKKAPFLIFDSLDRNLFQGFLKGMVLLKWRTLSDNAPGVTSAPDVKDTRICIELNTRPFDERGAGLDELLDALIHQMIHAYFLVCCGKQGKSDEQDGRLLDALHFGILMYSIQEISGDCEEGYLPLSFYAHRRACRSRAACRSQRLDSYGRGLDRSIARPYIAIDPHGVTVGPPPNDGQSHCMHDNRRFRGADIRNWQVSNYASAIELDMDKKDSIIYDLDVSGELKPVERLEGPPSSTYVVLVWDGKKVMAPREKALEFESLAKSGKKEGKYELHMPKCDFLTLKCVWDFIQHGKYSPTKEESESEASKGYDEPKGPPIIVHGSGKDKDADTTDGVVVHIRVFKAADSMKFSELQKYSLDRLYDMPTTSDDPIIALREIYEGAESKPINAELHKWTRKFLARTDESSHARHACSDRGSPWAGAHHYYDSQPYRGTSNYEKLISIHGDRFTELYHSHPVLKDDSKLVVAELSYPGHLTDDLPSVPTPINNTLMTRMPSSPFYPAYAPAHPRHLQLHPYDLEPSALYPPPHHIRAQAAVLPSYPAALEDAHLPSSPYYDYFSRSDGRRMRVDALTGDRYTRERERWRDSYGLS